MADYSRSLSHVSFVSKQRRDSSLKAMQEIASVIYFFGRRDGEPVKRLIQDYQRMAVDTPVQ